MNLVAARRAHAIRSAVLHEDLVHMLAVLDLHAHLFGALRHLEAHLMTELFGDHGTVSHVVRHQHGVDCKGQV